MTYPQQSLFVCADRHYQRLKEAEHAPSDWRGITSSMLRGLGLFNMEKWARDEIARNFRHAGGEQFSEAFAKAQHTRARPRTPLVELAEIAVAYDEEFASEGGRKINERLAKRFGFSATTIANELRTARERGLRSGTTQGKPGGAATDAAYRLIDDARKDSSE